jgi:hypothetical protein
MYPVQQNVIIDTENCTIVVTSGFEKHISEYSRSKMAILTLAGQVMVSDLCHDDGSPMTCCGVELRECTSIDHDPGKGSVQLSYAKPTSFWSNHMLVIFPRSGMFMNHS